MPLREPADGSGIGIPSSSQQCPTCKSADRIELMQMRDLSPGVHYWRYATCEVVRGTDEYRDKSIFSSLTFQTDAHSPRDGRS
jgi:hypothetical protein